MANVLKADGGAADAWAEIDLGSEQADVWVTFDLAFPAAALAFWLSAPPYLLQVFDAAHGPTVDGADNVYADAAWNTIYDSMIGWQSGGVPAADVWQSVELNQQSDGTAAFYIDGVLILSGTANAAGVQYVRAGLAFVSADPANVGYYRNVKVGTTRGDDDLFAWPDTETDLSAWTTTSGDVSVVADPYPPTPPPPPSRRFFAGYPWRFILTTLAGETVTSLERLAANRTVTVRLNQPAESRGQVPSNDPRVNIVDVEPGLDAPHLSYLDRLLYGFRREQETPDVWTCRFAGIVAQIEDTAQADQPYSNYTAFDPWQYLFRRAIYDGTSNVGTDGLIYEDRPGNEIVQALLDNSIAMDGPAFIDYDAGAWDTTATITITFQQGTSLGDALRQLAPLQGMDIEFRPVYDTARPGVCCDVYVHTQMGQTRDAAIFHWGTDRSVVGISSLLDGGQAANDVRFHNGPGGPLVTPAVDTASQARYGVYTSERFFPGQVVEAAVETFAQKSLGYTAYGRRTVTISPNPLLSPKPFLDYGLGDRVPVYATRSLRQAIPWDTQPTVYQRVYGIPITLGDDGVERVDRLLASPDGFT